MAQLDFKGDSLRGDENGDCGSANLVTNTYSFFGMGLPENNLMEEMEQLRVPDEGTLQEPNDGQNTTCPAGESNGNLNQLRSLLFRYETRVCAILLHLKFV